MFFTGWLELLRVVVLGVTSYLALLVILRLSGKRTLSKLNAIDFVVTVALGSTLATVLLLFLTASLAAGVTALVLLAGLQWVVASPPRALTGSIGSSRPSRLFSTVEDSWLRQ